MDTDERWTRGTQTPESPAHNNAEYNTDFLSEQIKNRPLNRGKLLRRSLITIFLAVLFGGVSCFAFFMFTPILNRMMNPQEEPAPIELPAPVVEEEMAPEEMVAQDAELYAASEEEPAPVPDEESISRAVEKILSEKSPDAAFYGSMFGALRETAQTAMRSMATVSIINEDYDWFNDPYEITGRHAGVILAKTEREIIVLTKGADLENAGKLKVTFTGGISADARLKAQDPRTGCAAVSVSRQDMEEEDFSKLTPILLGNSAGAVLDGRPVIAIGAPTGEIGSIEYGIVTASQHSIDLTDTSYCRISTSIYGSRSASGILIDTNGLMVGLIDLSYNDRTMPNQLSAIGISELRNMVQDLSNGIVRPRLGIHGADVTEIAASELEVPRGAYVRFAEMDSPAMEAGIQSGDVITQFNGAIILRYKDLITELSHRRPGEEVKAVVKRAGPDGYTETELTIVLGE